MKMSTFKKMITFIFAAGVFTSSVGLAQNEVIGKKIIELKNAKGQAMVLTKKVEGKLGKPYSVELLVKCHKDKTQWESLVAVDSEAVCDVKPQSGKLSADGKSISILIRETDAANYNEQSKVLDAKALGEVEPQCQKSGKEFLFSVENYCQ